jgi:UDP-glucose 4-epimerase
LVRGDGTAVRDYVPASVLGSVIGILARRDRGAPTILNVCSGVGHTTVQVIKKLESWLGKKIPFQLIPSVDGEIHRSILDPSLLQEWAGISRLETSFEKGLKALERIISRLDA